MEVKTDLSLVSIEELVDELNKRTDANIFAYLQRTSDKLDDFRFFYHGGSFVSIGLCEALKGVLIRDTNDKLSLSDEDKDDEP